METFPTCARFHAFHIPTQALLTLNKYTSGYETSQDKRRWAFSSHPVSSKESRLSDDVSQQKGLFQPCYGRAFDHRQAWVTGKIVVVQLAEPRYRRLRYVDDVHLAQQGQETFEIYL